MLSIKRCLNRNLIIFLVIILLLLFVSLGLTSRYILRSYALNHLQHDIDTLIRSLTLMENNEWQLDSDGIPRIYETVHSGHYYRIMLPDQILESRSIFDQKIELPRPQSQLSMAFDTETEDDQDLLVLQYQAKVKNQDILFWIAEDMTFVYHTLWKYLSVVGVISLMLIWILITIQHRLLNRSFRIFDQLKDRIQKITDEQITLDEAHVPEEVAPLAIQIQSLANQLKQRNERTRRAIGDLSHELKRPLLVLSMEAQSRQDNELLAPLADIKNIIDRELRRARVAGSRDIGGQFDPETELEDLLVVLRKIYQDKTFSLQVSGSLNRLNLDRDDMLELFGNLIDNAGKYCRQNVQIQLSAPLQTFQCVIEDDGPGVPEDQYEHVLRPGTRLDESIHGHGIGLRICRDIINGYSGKLTFACSALGGLKVSVQFPA